MASRSVPGTSAAHRARPGADDAWPESLATIFPHSRAGRAVSQEEPFNVSLSFLAPLGDGGPL